MNSNERSFKISVIVPVYNVEQYLEQCIESLINQSLKEIQIILIDDGSKDKSGKIIDAYAAKDNRILAIHKKNGGISSARNEGLKYVAGEYITFVDSDDWVEQDMYKVMLEAAQRTDADIVSTDLHKYEEEVIEQDLMYYYLLRGDVSCCNKIFKFTDEIKNGFSFDSKNVSIDIKGCYDLFKECKRWTIIPGAYYNYRQDNMSYGRSGFNKNDLNSVRLTEMVAEEAKMISLELYDVARNHVIHAKFDVLNKVAIWGTRDDESLKLFQQIKKSYIVDIRNNIFKCMKTSYFTRNEKLQLACIAISYKLYMKIKEKYIVQNEGMKAKSIRI